MELAALSDLPLDAGGRRAGVVGQSVGPVRAPGAGPLRMRPTI
ncbi:hypothetical protein ACIRVF_16925 [Kitasatospora sp. NPDC101157]